MNCRAKTRGDEGMWRAGKDLAVFIPSACSRSMPVACSSLDFGSYNMILGAS